MIKSERGFDKMNGYCGECDKQIEFHNGTVIQEGNKIFLVCPWCDEKELLKEIEVKE
jgi:DNA-directed RNA polymerase subunit RPC12/RpoP